MYGTARDDFRDGVLTCEWIYSAAIMDVGPPNRKNHRIYRFSVNLSAILHSMIMAGDSGILLKHKVPFRTCSGSDTESDTVIPCSLEIWMTGGTDRSL